MVASRVVQSSKSEETHSIVVKPELVQIGGDLIVGALLSQIVYWCQPNAHGKTRMRVERHGVFWVAKTREEWMAETGLTLAQYKRALATLKKVGLVEVRVMRFNGLAMGHLRLDTDRLDGALAAVGAIPPNRLAQNDPTGWCKTDQPYTENTAESTSRVLAQTQEQEPTKNSGDREKTQGRGGGKRRRLRDRLEDLSLNPEESAMSTADEILRRHRARAPSPRASLASHWQSRYKLLHARPGDFQKALPGKERGQLRLLQQALGKQTKEVIDYVMNYWLKFATRAGAAGGTPFPVTPHIGFLLKHHDIAMNMAVPPVQSIAPKHVDTSAPPVYDEPAVIPQESPHHLTDEELADLIAGLKE